MDDFGGYDIGIDPESIDYSGGSDYSNADIESMMSGDQFDVSNWDTGGGYDGSGGGALTAAASVPGGSPNVGSPSARELAVAGGNETPSGGKSLLEQAKSALLYDKKGEMDLGKLLKIGLGIGNMVGSKKSSSTAANPQLQAMLAQQLAQQAKGTWTPQQAQWSQSFLQTPVNPNRGVQYASEMRSPITPSRGYAEGGGIGAMGDGRYGAPAAESFGVEPQDIFSRTHRQRERNAGLGSPMETLQRGNVPRTTQEHVPITDLLRSLPMLFKSLGFEDSSQQGFAEGGDVDQQAGALTQAAPFAGYVESDTPGQTDLFDISVAGGEYVMDADSVAALGDGNNAAGAARLDELRESLRAAKRAAPADEIPPSMEELGGGMAEGEMQ